MNKLIYANIKNNIKQFILIVLYMLLSSTLIYSITTMVIATNVQTKEMFYKNEDFRTFTIRLDTTKQAIDNCFSTLKTIKGIEKFEQKNGFLVIVIVKKYNSLKYIQNELSNKNYKILVNTNNEFEIMKLESLIQNLNLLMYIVLIIVFISMIFILFKVIHERSKEIALYKSIGYPNKTILFIFIIELLISQLISFVIGMLVCWYFSIYISPLLLKYFFSVPNNYNTFFNFIIFLLIQLLFIIAILLSSFIQLNSVRKISISILIKD